MKIAVVYHQLISEGGLETYLLGLIRSFLDAGHEVAAVTARTDAHAAACGARVVEVPGGRVRTGRDLLRFDRESAAAVAGVRADVVLGFGRTTMQDVHRAGGGCHKVYSALLPRHKQLRPKNQVELRLERELYTGGRTRHFVVNSAMVGRELQAEYGVPEGRISVLRTPVDTAHFAPEANRSTRARVRAELGTPMDRDVILFVSREHRRKGLETLVEALFEAEASPNGDAPELWVAGAPVRRKLLQRSRGRLRWLGSQRDLGDVYRAADFFVHPTRYDACANTVLQAMASGLVPIVSRRDGTADLIEDGLNGWRLAEPGDAGELAGILARARAAGDDERREIGTHARATVLPFTRERHLAEWLQVIESLRGPAAAE